MTYLAGFRQINEMVEREARFVQVLNAEIRKAIIGQDRLVERVLVALLADGHILLEGVPGLAKTLLVKTIGQAIQAGFSRIQFTPDLLPADLIGTRIYNPRTGDFSVQKGPVFSNLILADEVNRAPAKVQSALLEAMQEQQVTIGDETFPIEAPFLVLATQNPVEMEGTFPLPEAQLDRFFLLVKLGYPSHDDESEMLARFGTSLQGGEAVQVANPDRLKAAQEAVASVRVDDALRGYVVAVSAATRESADLALGASPRASLSLMRAAQARAAMEGRDYVVPDDVKALATPVLAHRLVLTSTARLRSVTAEHVVDAIMASVPVPIEK